MEDDNAIAIISLKAHSAIFDQCNCALNACEDSHSMVFRTALANNGLRIISINEKTLEAYLCLSGVCSEPQQALRANIHSAISGICASQIYFIPYHPWLESS